MTKRDVIARARSFWVKHKVSILDLGALAAAMAVAAYLAFSVDIFANEAGLSEKTLTLEIDELMLLGGLLMLGLLIFAIRRYVAQKREIVRRTSAERQVRELAFQDPLTGLANRRQFNEALQVALKSPPASDAVHALFLCDLNGFKQINDVYGHGVGDELLVVVAQRLLKAVRESDLAARVGGDEFAILAQHLMGPEAAATVAQRIIASVGEPIVIAGVHHTVGIGVGIALLDTEDAADVLRRADVALYRAKAERRSAFRFFAEEMDALIRERDSLERELRAAVAADAIVPVYQPSMDLQTGRVASFEAVPRWIDASGHEIPAIRFIPIAEETGVIHELAEHLLRKACAAAALWPADVRLSVDVHRGQLTDGGLARRMLAILAETGVDPRRLEVEIPESVLVDDLPGLRQAFGALREAGVRIALDHFGTGYSTLYHLREFQIDRVKIDRSFVAGGGAEGARMLNALAGLGRGLGMEVAVDGMDSLVNGRDILGAGIQQAQGDAFGTALTALEAASLLRSEADATRRAS